MGEVDNNLGVRMAMSVCDSGVCFKAGSRAACWAISISRRACCRMERMASSEFPLLDAEEGWAGSAARIKHIGDMVAELPPGREQSSFTPLHSNLTYRKMQIIWENHTALPTFLPSANIGASGLSSDNRTKATAL